MTKFDDMSACLDRIAAGTHTETDIETLRKALRTNKNHDLVQLGKYNINIGQGQQLQIGDHIYHGSDAKTIRQVLLEVLGEHAHHIHQRTTAQEQPSKTIFWAWDKMCWQRLNCPEDLEYLKTRLLNKRVTTPGILAISAIRGLGGIGKSTLAAALAWDQEVQSHFSDGILWATLGQQPELLSLLSGWIQALRDYDFRPTTVENASAHLQSLLQNKAILLC